MDTSSGKKLAWWDREYDATGKPIRQDVRVAACQVWDDACRYAAALLGEPCEASGLMERAVAQVARYLDRRDVPCFANDAAALLMHAFRRGAWRRLKGLRRLEFVGRAEDISCIACFETSQDSRLDAEKAAGQLSERTRRMYVLKQAGYDWQEIAQVFGISAEAARMEFSRELKRVRLRLQKDRLATTDRNIRRSESVPTAQQNELPNGKPSNS